MKYLVIEQDSGGYLGINQFLTIIILGDTQEYCRIKLSPSVSRILQVTPQEE
jgi:hypothetical protein